MRTESAMLGRSGGRCGSSTSFMYSTRLSITGCSRSG